MQADGEGLKNIFLVWRRQLPIFAVSRIWMCYLIAFWYISESQSRVASAHLSRWGNWASSSTKSKGRVNGLFFTWNI